MVMKIRKGFDNHVNQSIPRDSGPFGPAFRDRD